MAEQRTLDAELLAAADAVVERWHSRDWKQPHTAEYIARLAAAVGAVKRRAPPALDTEGLPPLIWGDDLEAWLEVRDEAEIVAAIRAAQRHAYDAGQQSQAARIQHLTHERDLALAAARQSAPEGAPVVPDILFDGHAVYSEITRHLGKAHCFTPDAVSTTLDAVVRLIRRAALTPASPQPADQNKMEKNDE
jgi:hypothetical protein